MRCALIFLVATVYFLTILFGTLPSQGAPFLVRALTYQFFHANILHLIVNCIAIWQVFKPVRKDNLRNLVISFIIGVAVYGLSPRPVLGISNIIFAMIGLHTPALSHPWWRQTNVRIFFVITVLMAFIPSISAITHIASFIIGAGIASLFRSVRSVQDDIKRAAHI